MNKVTLILIVLLTTFVSFVTSQNEKKNMVSIVGLPNAVIYETRGGIAGGADYKF